MLIKSMAVVVALFTLAPLQGLQSVEPDNIPDEVLPAMQAGSFAHSYDINSAMNPFYLRADFDGDGQPDYAIWIKHKGGQQSGIAVWLSSKRQFVIVGGGEAVRLGKSRVADLNFINFWKVFRKGSVEEGVSAGKAPKLRGDAILVGKRESASGLLYWTGTRFAWYQQGD